MDKIIFFTILVLFPFGQLIKFGIFNLFDAAVLLLAIITFLKKPKYPEWYRYFIYFILACVLSLLVNYKLVDIKSILYLVRFWSYSMIAVYIFNFVVDHKAVIRSLLAVSVSAATLGWLQYIFWPNLTALKYLGWDDHLLRMVGTFLDPTYLGLILVLGIILAEKLNIKKIIYFLLISLAFTYSRSSYLIASLFLIYKKKFLPLFIFILIIFLLPKNIGEGTNLIRTNSGSSKLINYKETIEIFKKSPFVGIGFNNMCNARQLYLNDTNVNSHSCSGSDSSILFLLATTGIVGLILFLNFLLHVPINYLLVFSFLAVFIHSLFANSLFYPHIMFWMFALLGLRSKSNS
jgi:hypothetical protein